MLQGQHPPHPTQQDNSPEVPFVGGVLHVVADVVEHAVGCGAVSGIKHLQKKVHGGIAGCKRAWWDCWLQKVHGGIADCLLSLWQPQGGLPF